MLKRTGGYLTLRNPADAPAASSELESLGYTLLHRVFTSDEVDSLRQDITEIFDRLPRDDRTAGLRDPGEDDAFRYEMLNRSAACQAAIGHRAILDVIEPLLGEDCHVIANTAWRNPPKPNDPAQGWHVDGGPHVPMPEGVDWPENIPHPVFAIGAHLFLQDLGEDDGPTGVIPGSHRSGRFPPRSEVMNPALTYKGQGAVPLLARAGDVALFVSDVWHRRLPTGASDRGRFFLQCHYARRDIAQRIRTTAQTNHLSELAIERATTGRGRTLIGLHQPGFYDG
ncbi:MAG: phytanoyl-CoA dioxygenase family protein [Pseudomonadota bacterium]